MEGQSNTFLAQPHSTAPSKHSEDQPTLQKHNLLTLSHTVSTVDHTLTAVVRADERVAIVAKAEEKWVCGEGGDPLIRPTAEIPKLGPPFKYVQGGLSALSNYYYASSTKKL